MPASASFQEAAGLVISAGTAYEGLLDRGRLQAGETVLITAAAGGVGSAGVQIAVAHGARVLGVASAANHEYLRGLGASDVFDYHTADWAEQVRATVPGGVDVLLDCAGGQTRDEPIGAVRDGGRAYFIVLQSSPPQLERGITGESFAATAADNGWRNSRGSSMPASYVHSSRRCCRWITLARHLRGSRAGTRAAKSC